MNFERVPIKIKIGRVPSQKKNIIKAAVTMFELFAATAKYEYNQPHGKKAENTPISSA